MADFVKKLVIGSLLLSASLATTIPRRTDDGFTTTRSSHGTALQGVDGTTVNPMNCTYPSKFFRQLVNHPQKDGHPSLSSSNNDDVSDPSQTFLQQYKVIDDYFKPGGPIFFYQGPEDPLGCFEYFSFGQYAIEVGALLVGIEHRFFGLSVPSNLSYEDQLTWPTSSLSSLTLDNVLLDSVELVEWVKRSVPGAKESKVISFGASYGGFLVALQRLHYPDIFYAAFPSSPPIGGIISDPKDPLAFALGDWNSQTLQDASANASAKIKTAIADVRQRIDAGNFDGLKDGLSLCTQPNSSTGTDTIINSIAGSYNTLIQYDYASQGLPFNTLINQTLQEGSDSLRILNVAMKLSSAFNDQECIDWDTKGLRTTMVIPNQYLICTYMPYPIHIYATAESIFGPLLPDLTAPRLNDADCQKAFGMNSITAGIEYQRHLRIDQQSLETSTHIFFTEGTMDPVTALGPKVWWTQPNRDLSRVYIISGGAHGSEALPPVPLDSAAVNVTRVAQLNTIKEWLGICDLPEVYPMYTSMNETEDFPGISEYITKGIGG